jgi:sulfatase maturation enzyme AslB (radical SAM superfamily)
MSRGEWPAACERCSQAEDTGATSIRQLLNEQFDLGRKAGLLEDTAADGTLGHPMVRYADIRLGNVCNLTCRMCGPYASRLWEPYYNKVQPKRYRSGSDVLKVLGQNNWVKRESLEWLLAQNLPSVEELHFGGGEPLIIPEMAEALELCVRSGRASEIRLSYNTNLTVLPEKVISLWKYFNGVSLFCSVDGFGKVTEYIRRPSKWSDIDRNLHLVDENFEDWNIHSASVHTTVQMHNVLTLGDLFEYLRAAGFQHLTPFPNLIPLFNPEYLSIQALPASSKAVVRERLEAEIERIEKSEVPKAATATGTIRTTLAYMDAADKTKDLNDFFSFSKASDQEFGDSWREAAPELGEHLSSQSKLYWLRSLITPSSVQT